MRMILYMNGRVNFDHAAGVSPDHSASIYERSVARWPEYHWRLVYVLSDGSEMLIKENRKAPQ